jgi:serine/threonine-protein kinase HipA
MPLTDHLAVWLHGNRVGSLEQGLDREIRYVPDQDAPLSVAASGLAPWSPDLTQNWFDGLLPEEGRRARLAARLGLRTEDTFGLLAQVGWECAGAVAVLPDGVHPSAGRYDLVSDSTIGEQLDGLPSLAGIPDSEIRMSLGGAQEKLLVARVGDSWAIPLEGAPSTHILKPEPEQWPGLASAEAWALVAASKATPATEAVVSDSLGSRPVLIVTRYDRPVRGGAITRLHQEDLCQALGLPPGAKYAPVPPRPDSPSFLRLANILRERSADPPAELERLLAQVVVSVALRNADLHAKNLSIINEAGVVRLAPVYDVSATTAFVPRTTSVGLPVGGKFKITEIGTEHLVREALTWGIPERRSRQVVADAIERLRDGIELADDRWPNTPQSARDAAIAGVFAVAQEDPGRRSAAGLQASARPRKA